jgi:hypothetical protein
MPGTGRIRRARRAAPRRDRWAVRRASQLPRAATGTASRPAHGCAHVDEPRHGRAAVASWTTRIPGIGSGPDDPGIATGDGMVNYAAEMQLLAVPRTRSARPDTRGSR